MSRNRRIRNLDLYDDLSDDDYDDFGSMGNSYGSLSEYYAPPTLSYDSLIPDENNNNNDNEYFDKDNKPQDHEELSSILSEIKPILGDSFSISQLITAIRENNYNTQNAIDWLLDDNDDDQFDLDDDYYGEERLKRHSGASIFSNSQINNETNNNNNNNNQNNNDTKKNDIKHDYPAPQKLSEQMNNKSQKTKNDNYSPSSLANVLCISPSYESANSICNQIYPSKYLPSPPIIFNDPDIKPFCFDEPSPDDIVIQKQTNKSSKNTNNNKNIQSNTQIKKNEPFKPIIVANKKKGNNNNKNTSKKQQQNEKKKNNNIPKKQEKINKKEDEPSSISKKESSIIIPKPKKLIKQMTTTSRNSIIESITNATEKAHLNLVIVGHVDAGKSTTMGRLLLELGNIDKRTMHKYRKLAAEDGKSSFVYAWILDEHTEERSRGVTIDVGLNYIETDTKRITILDAPGHKDFVPNMITGAAQADSAILVIDSTVGDFEKGISDDGQTKEHTLLIKSLGVEQLIVAVNKLDMCNYSQDRYNKIVDELRKFLKQAGFKTREVRFVPCSGFHGENLVKRSEESLCSWYSGDTLIQAIDHLNKPTRLIEGPLRMCISDVYKTLSSGVTIGGKIESGIIGVGDQILVIPGYHIFTIKTIEIQDKTSKYASAGDNVSIGTTGIEITNFGIGYFICDPQKPIPFTNRFIAKIITFKVKYPITQGSSVTLQYQNVTVESTIIRLLELLDRSNGSTIKKRPRSIIDGNAAIVAIKTEHPVCVELFSNNKHLGRFTLRENGVTIATGIITKLLQRRLD